MPAAATDGKLYTLYLMLMKNIAFYIFFGLIKIQSFGQITIPSYFVETPLPKYNTKEMHNLNYSRDEFEVKIENNDLKVSKTKEINERELKINDGKLIARNFGEFGGKLVYKSDENKFKEKTIFEGNVSFVFEFQNKLYFISSYQHGDSDFGNLYELVRIKKKFRYSKILELESAPQAYYIFNNKIYIVASEKFFIINNFKKEILPIDSFWAITYPNSLVVFDEKNIFFGMRGGIVKIDSIEKTAILYKAIKH